MAITFGSDTQGVKNKFIEALLREGMNTGPIQHWSQGASRMAHALLGGLELREADQLQKQGPAEIAALLQGMGGQGGAMQTSTPSPEAKPVQAALLPPTNAPRPDVVPSARVWGDAEAEAAGIYPPSNGAPSKMPPVAPQMAQAAPQMQTPMQPNVQQSQLGGIQDMSVPQLSKLFTDAKSPTAKQFLFGLIQQKLQHQMKPSDYDIQQRPDGTVIAINKKNPQDMKIINAPGAGESAIKFEADKAAAVATAKGEAERRVGQEQRETEKKAVANIVVQDVDRAIGLIEKSPASTTGIAGPFLSKIGGTSAANVKALVDTVKANAGFAELQKMRNNSPTGGALGQVSEREIAYLQSTIGNMEQSQTADQLKDNLRRVKNAYLDIIHGPGSGPREKLGFEGKPGGNKTKSGVTWSVD